MAHKPTTKRYVLVLVLILSLLAVITSYISFGTTTPLTAQRKTSSLQTTQAQTVTSCSSSSRVDHFLMTKIEKTGSSTLYAIFVRFVLENQVSNLLIQGIRKRYHIDWTRPRGEGWSIGPRPTQQADVLIDHARYNEAMFDKYLVKDYKYIVPVREPESWLKSAVGYYSKFSKIHMPAEKLVMKESAFYAPRKMVNPMRFGSWFHLVQLQWLGFDYKQRSNLTAIKDYIDYIVPKIDIPVLLEQFDASLVILRKRFCWEYTDIFYAKYTVGERANPKPLSNDARKVLFSPEANLGEKLLYDKINESWWRQPEIEEDGFWDEVEHFQQLNYNVSNVWCPQVMKSGDSHTIAANRWHGNLSIKKRLCRYLQQTKLWLLLALYDYSKKDNHIVFEDI